MEYKVIEFEIEKEQWNKYEIEDGTILAAKYVLERLVHVQEDDGKEGLLPHGKPSYQVWYSLESERSHPLEQDDPIEGVEPKFIDYDQMAESWNKYRYNFNGESYLLKLKLSVLNIGKYVDTYDKYGYPRYSITTALNINVVKY